MEEVQNKLEHILEKHDNNDALQGDLVRLFFAVTDAVLHEKVAALTTMRDELKVSYAGNDEAINDIKAVGVLTLDLLTECVRELAPTLKEAA